MSMSPAYQPLHILRKDATHLWPETLVSIALLIAFALWAARDEHVLGLNALLFAALVAIAGSAVYAITELFRRSTPSLQ